MHFDHISSGDISVTAYILPRIISGEQISTTDWDCRSSNGLDPWLTARNLNLKLLGTLAVSPGLNHLQACRNV